MPAHVMSCALHELDGLAAQVDVDASRGMTGFTVVGLPDAAVKESRLRVRSAIRDSGPLFPNKRSASPSSWPPRTSARKGQRTIYPSRSAFLLPTSKSGQGDRQDSHHRGAHIGRIRTPCRRCPTHCLPSSRRRDFDRPGARRRRSRGRPHHAPDARPHRAREVAGGSHAGPARDSPIRARRRPDCRLPPGYVTDFAEIEGQEHLKRALAVAPPPPPTYCSAVRPRAGNTRLTRSRHT